MKSIILAIALLTIASVSFAAPQGKSIVASHSHYAGDRFSFTAKLGQDWTSREARLLTFKSPQTVWGGQVDYNVSGGVYVDLEYVHSLTDCSFSELRLWAAYKFGD